MHRQNRRGAMLVLIAVCIPILIIMAVFAVDVAYMELVRSELRTATDAAAHAGTRTLSLTQDIAQARQEAKDAAQKNLVAGSPLLLDDSDIEVGLSLRSDKNTRFSFTSSTTPANAMRVTGYRTQSSLSGPVNLFFARFLGRGSFEPVQEAIATQVDRDLALVLDESGSMDGQPWTDLSTAVDAFLTALDGTPQNELVSLETFDDSGHHRESLTSDYNKVRDEMDHITPDGMTAIGEGMEKGIESLSKVNRLAAKAIVVMTDGIHNTGVDPVVVAQDARAAGITVYTVTFGDSADQTMMQNVAATGGGRHWHAPTGADLIDVFQEIANSTPTLLTK
jgi:Flp pilus assembly protein TadG